MFSEAYISATSVSDVMFNYAIKSLRSPLMLSQNLTHSFPAKSSSSSLLSLSSVQRIANYILGKRGRDGGYLHYQYLGIFDSCVEDTYYAVKSLRLLSVHIPNPEKTAFFLKSVQKRDGGYSSLSTAYYAIKGLYEFDDLPENPRGAINYLKSKLEKALSREEFQSLKNSTKSVKKARPKIEDGILKSWDLTDKLYVIEISSKLSDLFMIVEALNTLNYEVEDKDRLIEAIFSHKMWDGGFGDHYSSIDETFYALATLQMLGQNVVELADTAAWISECEDPLGGFKVRPSITRAYLVPHLYYGLRSMEILNLEPNYEQRHIEFLKKCMNNNGGFRNSVHIGLSSLEATFYALSALAILDGEKL